MAQTEEKNWLDILKEEFDNPAVILWRAVELRQIDRILAKRNLSEPILDLGCAEGKIARRLFKGRGLIGLDNCWELISHSGESHAYKAVIVADACRMPYKNGSFGSVFSNCVIEHIFDLDSVLSGVSRVLRHNGIFLFTVPSHKFGDFLFFGRIFSNLGMKGLSGWYKRKRNQRLSHYHCYEHKKWEQILKEKGFELLDYKYYMTERTTFIWDLLAALSFGFRYAWPLTYFLPLINKWLVKLSSKYYFLEDKAGGGLVLVAQKSTP